MCSLLRIRTCDINRALTVRQLAILVLPTTSRLIMKNHLGSILNALENVHGGDYLEISFSGEKNSP